MIPYIYHFEICERSELPEWLRNDIFTVVSWVQRFVGLDRVLVKEVGPAIDFLVQGGSTENKPFNVIELGSGTGDSLLALSKTVSTRVNWVATDLHPRPLFWRDKFADRKNISWKDKRVSFENFEEDLKAELEAPSLLFLNCAFHHMHSRKVKEFLARASTSHVPILIVEPLQRTVLSLIYGALGGLLAPLVIFSSRIPLRQRLRLLLVTWVIPIVPLTNFHDGIISALRQRRKPEWVSLVEGTSFSVEMKSGLGPFKNFQTISIHK